MITIRRGDDRGRTRLDWLDSRHTFSFGDYDDPEFRGFHDLLVINDDRVAPGGGFGMHRHKDMEIITIIVSGALEHRDSIGNGSVIGPGDVQRMTAGTGILHSEFNASATEPAHFIQIWIVPRRRDLPPDYGQRNFSRENRRGRLLLLVSPDGRDGSLSMNQDVDVYAATLAAGQSVSHPLGEDRCAWVHVVAGKAVLNGHLLESGDGAAASAEDLIELSATGNAEVLLFDLPH